MILNIVPSSNIYIEPLLVKTNIEEQQEARQILDLHLNETPSYIPNIFLKKDHQSLPIDHSLNFSIVQQLSPMDLTRQLSEDIKNHFEMRIQLFFLQLLMSYKTQVIFQQFKTLIQAGLKQKENSCDLVEAHCNTLPNLSYLLEKDEEAHFSAAGEGKDVPIQPYIFAGNSSYIKIWNSTTKLPRFVNEIDSLIDTMTKHDFLAAGTFRNYCVKILNRNSQGKFNPKSGLKAFLMSIDKLLDYLEKNEKKETIGALVLEYYRSVTKSYFRQTETNQLFQKLILNLKIDNPELYYGKLQEHLYEKMAYETYVWDRIEIIRKIAFAIIGTESCHNKEEFIRSLLLEVSSCSPKKDLIEQSIITTQNEKIPGAKAHEHVTNCFNDNAIRTACVIHLEKNSIHDLKIILDYFPSTWVFQTLSNMVQAKLASKPQHLVWIIKMLLLESFALTKKGTENAKKMKKFLNLDQTHLNIYSSSMTMSKHLRQCLFDKELVGWVKVVLDILNQLDQAGNLL